MKIDRQTGLADTARQCPSPNYDERPDGCEADLIVLHNISLPPNQFGGEGIDQLFTNQLNPDDHPFYAEICHLRVASHLLIRRDGEVVQYVPFHKRAFHAGVSEYRGRERCNDFSVGIEMEGSDCEAFTDAQYQQLVTVIRALLKAYPTLNLQNITGHEHIAPGRKTDPGPFFDWDRLSVALDCKLPAPANVSTVIDLLRHGEPEGGAMYRGCGTDDPLSDLGWQQMRAAVQREITSEGRSAWDVIVSSPMIRCKAFAEEVAEQQGLPLVVIEDLKEAGYGAWEGRTPDDIRLKEPDAYRALYRDPINCRPDGAEPLQAFTHRVIDAFEEVMVRYAGKRVLLVSHAGTMRAIQSQLLRAPIEYQQRIHIPYAGMYQVKESAWKGRQVIYK